MAEPTQQRPSDAPTEPRIETRLEEMHRRLADLQRELQQAAPGTPDAPAQAPSPPAADDRDVRPDVPLQREPTPDPFDPGAGLGRGYEAPPARTFAESYSLPTTPRIDTTFSTSLPYEPLPSQHAAPAQPPAQAQQGLALPPLAQPRPASRRAHAPTPGLAQPTASGPGSPQPTAPPAAPAQAFAPFPSPQQHAPTYATFQPDPQAIIADAEQRAAQILHDAQTRVVGLRAQIDRLLAVRAELLASARSMIGEYETAIRQIEASEIGMQEAHAAAHDHAVAGLASAPQSPSAGHRVSGTISVEAGPFADIAELGSFEQALGRIPGADDVYVRGFSGDQAQVDVTFDRSVDVVAALGTTLNRSFDVEQPAPNRIRLRLHPAR